MEEEKKPCECGECEDECECECDIVELKDDSGKTLKFYHLGTIEFKSSYYAAFQPAEEIEGVEADELVIFEVSGDSDEDSELLPIEDQDLLDEVYEEFCRIMEDADDCDCENCDDVKEECECGCHKHD